ncbi:MAG TPA: NAD(P)/FAD-dependent oxidoreductase [Pseudomonadales bacterium]|nr:NAD(P)/FAD-dependent oxidoreductase [Pseudomonadales bacterium]
MVKLADKFDSWQPITEDDAAIAAALEDANIPALMAAMVHITGDPSIVRGDIRPDVAFFGDPQAGISEAHQAEVRARALQVLKDYRDRGCTLPAAPSLDVIREMMDFITGEKLPDDYGGFLLSELSLEGEDPYEQPGLADLPKADRDAFHVVVVGAGMSGLLAGYRLKQAGIPFTIVEKNDDVGGTWLENTYPGCRVDSPNHTYSYSFAPNDWPQHFSPQPVLLDYFRTCAEQMALRDSIRFGTEVKRSVYDEASATWTVHVTGADGIDQTLTANAIISATGQLNRPRFPDIPGQDRFAGPSWHSARWNWDQDLTGKRVGVVGTGASAFQFVPQIAKQAASVTVFQRTPPWIAPREEYHDDIPTGTHWLLNHVPLYAKWFRFLMFWRTSEGMLAAVRREEGWEGRDDAVSTANDELRQMLTMSVHEQLADRPDLIDKCIPKYPPAGKRMLVDNGTWLNALKRDNVTLLEDPIREITETGLVTESGEAHEFDVIIYGTGFYASRIAWPMEFVGRGGRELQQEWDGDPRAYLGITMPGYPNLFVMYGPNTNIVVNGSIVFFSECEMRYILGCIKLLIETGHGAMEPKQAVHDAYNERIDAGNAGMAWGAPHVRSWYKNAKGRVTQNWPFTLLEYWTATLAPKAEDFEFDDPQAPARRSA